MRVILSRRLNVLLAILACGGLSILYRRLQIGQPRTERPSIQGRGRVGREKALLPSNELDVVYVMNMLSAKLRRIE